MPIYLVRSVPVHGRLTLISGRCDFKFRNERENIWAETKGMSHSFILGFSDCREIAESRAKRKLQKKDQQIQSSECKEKEVHFVPAVARVSSLIIL